MKITNIVLLLLLLFVFTNSVFAKKGGFARSENPLLYDEMKANREAGTLNSVSSSSGSSSEGNESGGEEDPVSSTPQYDSSTYEAELTCSKNISGVGVVTAAYGTSNLGKTVSVKIGENEYAFTIPDDVTVNYGENSGGSMHNYNATWTDDDGCTRSLTVYDDLGGIYYVKCEKDVTVDGVRDYTNVVFKGSTGLETNYSSVEEAGTTAEERISYLSENW